MLRQRVFIRISQEKKAFGFGISQVGQLRDRQDSDEDAQEILLQQRHGDVAMRKRVKKLSSYTVFFV